MNELLAYHDILEECPDARSKFRVYLIRRKGWRGNDYLIGLELNSGYIHKYKKTNLFEKYLVKIPENAIRRPYKFSSWVDPYERLIRENNKEYKKIKEKFKSYKSYFIQHWRGYASKSLLVYVGDKDVHVYCMPKNSYTKFLEEKKFAYIEKILEIESRKTFVHKKGILVAKLEKGSYINIRAEEIIEFIINDEIIEYHYYPKRSTYNLLAFGSKYTYDLSAKKKMVINDVDSNSYTIPYQTDLMYYEVIYPKD